MARVKRGTTVKAKHKKVLDRAKGYRGRAHKAYTVAKERTEKGMQYAYRDRRTKKREFRSLWIQRINAAVRPMGMTYSVFMGKALKMGLALDRKTLAQLAFAEPESFKLIVEQVKAAA